MPGQRVFPFLLALLCAAVFATRVDVGFQRERQGIAGPHVTRDGRVSIELPDLSALADHPAAFVIRVRGGREAADVRVRFDGAEIAQASVAAGASVRIDASAVPARGQRHRLDIIGPAGDWRVREVEVANVHGFSRGAVSLFVVPAGRSLDAPLPLWAIAALFVALVAFPPRAAWPPRRWARVLHRVAAAFIVLFFTLALISGWVTPFRIIVALHTAVLGLLVLYADRVAAAGARVAAHVKPPLRQGLHAARFGVPHLLVIAFFLWCIAQFYVPGQGLTPLIMFGQDFYDRSSPDVRRARPFVWRGAGYDGQFYAQMATDPLLLDTATVDALDTPAYRAPRMLFPAIAYILGLGYTPFVLQTYAALNVLCWLALAWVLLRWLPPRDARHSAAWAACMLSHGLITSATRSLVDGPSMLLLALSIVAIEQGLRGLAAGILGVAVLGRDTNLVAAPMLAGPGMRLNSLQPLLHVLLIAAPLGLWLTYLRQIGLTFGESGGGNFGMPLAGYAAEWVASIRGMGPPGVSMFVASNLLSVVALTTQVVVLVAWAAPANAWWRLAAGYVVLFLLLGTPVWEGQPTAATRVLLPMTFAFNILLSRSRWWFWPLWVLGNLNVADSVLLLMPWVNGTHLY